MNIKAIAFTTLVSIAALGQAATITTLFGTGGSGTLAGGATDANYTIVSGPLTGATRVGHDGSFPVSSPWIANTATAKWIAPSSTVPTSAGSIASAPVGDYVYRTTFDLTGLIASTAMISGRYSSDNDGMGVFLNGVLLAGSQNLTERAFEKFTAFSANSGFVAGINTLEFHVKNRAGSGANPSGLIAEVGGTAEPVPEPASMAALALGLAGIARKRRAKKA